MKTIYLVRHGESEGNAGLHYQGPETPLTERGREQARIVAERCAGLPVDIMVAGTLRRIQDTALAISEQIGKPFESVDLFNERLRPTELIGRSYDDPEAKLLEKAWVASFIGEGPRVGDGENFDDLKARSAKALSYLGSLDAEHILVVTSGFLLRALIANIIFGQDLTEADLKLMEGAFKTENTGITVLRYNASKAHPWQIWVWNDHAHLG
jgi:probable phosphoglycerate mutase